MTTGITFAVETDVEDMRFIQENLSPKQIETVVKRTVNKTLRGGVTEIKKAITKNYAIKAKDITKAIRVTKASKGALPLGIITVGGSSIPLIKYPHRPKENMVWRES